MHRLGAADFFTLGRLARVRAEADRRRYGRTGLGLRIRPHGIDRLAVLAHPARERDRLSVLGCMLCRTRNDFTTQLRVRREHAMEADEM